MNLNCHFLTKKKSKNPPAMELESRNILDTSSFSPRPFEFQLIPKKDIKFTKEEKHAVLLSELDPETRKSLPVPGTDVWYSPHQYFGKNTRPFDECSYGQTFRYPVHSEGFLCCTFANITFMNLDYSTFSDLDQFTEYVLSLEPEKMKWIEYLELFDNVWDIKVHTSHEVKYDIIHHGLTTTSYQAVYLPISYIKSIDIYMKSPDCELFRVLEGWFK